VQTFVWCLKYCETSALCQVCCPGLGFCDKVAPFFYRRFPTKRCRLSILLRRNSNSIKSYVCFKKLSGNYFVHFTAMPAAAAELGDLMMRIQKSKQCRLEVDKIVTLLRCESVLSSCTNIPFHLRLGPLSCSWTKYLASVRTNKQPRENTFWIMFIFVPLLLLFFQTLKFEVTEPN